MGKNLKGKQLEKGISQRKDGMYSARFVTKRGKRVERYFEKYPEARRWLADARYEDSHGDLSAASGMTVNAWFAYWMETFKQSVRPNTQRNYRNRYQINIQPMIGHMQLADVKQLHCQNILNVMKDTYAASTVNQTFITLSGMFKSAYQNDIIPKNPVKGVTLPKQLKRVDDIRFLSVEEQADFLAAAKRGSNYEQYAMILETGLRAGELIGLTWGDIDWEKRTLTVNKTMEYRYSTGEWSAGPPKTEHGYRTICLTSKAYQLLRGLYDGRAQRKCASNMVLTFLDPRTERVVPVKMSDLVFLNPRTGEPTKNSSYDTHIRKICDKIGMNYFSMHSLRHTFATRAIEYGVQPKVLQKILGHASLKITMDRYVHVSNDSLQDAMEAFERHSGEAAGVNTCENGVKMA